MSSKITIPSLHHFHCDGHFSFIVVRRPQAPQFTAVVVSLDEVVIGIFYLGQQDQCVLRYIIMSSLNQEPVIVIVTEKNRDTPKMLTIRENLCGYSNVTYTVRAVNFNDTGPSTTQSASDQNRILSMYVYIPV